MASQINHVNILESSKNLSKEEANNILKESEKTIDKPALIFLN